MARGRIFKKPSGTYAFRVDVGTDPATGKRRQSQKSGFRTRERPRPPCSKRYTKSSKEGTATNRSSDELGPFLADWLETQRQHLKATTWSSYEVAAARITSRLGRRKLRALAPLDIQAFYAGLVENGSKSGKPLGPKSIRNTHVVLPKALADAERLGLMQRNAAAAAKPPAPEPVEHQTWDSDQIMQFFQAMAEDRLYAADVLAATTGMRRGEVLGLRWADADLDSNQLAILQTITTVNYKHVVTTPKTKRSRRVIYLDDHTTDALRAHRRQQYEEKKGAGPTWSDEHDLVFGTS